MEKRIKIVKNELNNLPIVMENLEDNDIVFKVKFRDTRGNSASNPVWGQVYDNSDRNLTYRGVGLYKEFDYDFPKAAEAEKLWSIIGKKVLPQVRIPDIDIVKEYANERGIISYIIVDNDKEDLIHMTDVFFNKFEREQLKKQRDLQKLEDILECIKIQINNPENYKEIEKQVIQTILLDSITNNRDRHANNWALVRDKDTSYYELALFDHAVSFIDMIDEKKHLTIDGWVGSYIITDEERRKKDLGETGKNLVKYICENYSEYFDDFCTKFDSVFDEIMKEVTDFNLNIDTKRLNKRLQEKRSYLRYLYNEREGIEYGE